MANASVISLNAGKLTPLVDVRSNTEKYSSGCRILENMIPRIYGPVVRRPGTKYINTVDDVTKKSRMIPFIYSTTIAYDLEFADKIINVYFNGVIVDADIASPYLEAELFQIQIKQSADVMWIIHPNHAPRKLSRVSATEFTLDKIPFLNGPFIERNDLENNDDVTIAVTGYTIDTVTDGAKDTAKITIEHATDISSQFIANQRFYITGATADTIDGAYTVHDTTATDYTGTTLTVYTNEIISSDPAVNGEVMVDDATVTLTTSSATFATGDSGHIDSLWKLTHKRKKVVTKGEAVTDGIIGEPIDVKGGWTFTTNGNWDATVEIQRLEDGENWETFRSYVSTISDDKGSRNVQKSDVEKVDGVQYRMFVTEYNSGTLTADFVVDDSTQDSIFKITATASTTSATATAILAAPENTVTKRWYEGSWSNVRGWPTTLTFFEERAVYAFTDSDQQNVWISKTNDFEGFDAGVDDNDAFTLTLPTANRGRWLGSIESLVAGTAGDEWRIRSTSFDQALTPTNFSIKQQTTYGSNDIQAAEVNDVIIFIDFVGRKIREHTWSDPKQKNVSPDLTALAEDITSGGITSLAVQKNPDSIVWFTIANSPYLISMTYEREQNVVAFAEHPLGGNGIVESVSVTPGESEDVVTLIVRRVINGSITRHIEQMQPRDWGDDTDIFFVDDGIIDTSGSTTISGLDHLEGETVSVMVDGALQTNKTVSSGSITIDEAGTRVVVGLPYIYRVSPMRLDQNTKQGTTHGSIKKISELVVSFHNTLNAKYGDGVDTYDIDWRTEEDYDSPPSLFIGDKTLSFDGGFSIDDPIIISGNDPFPCTVRAIIARIEKTGR